MHAKLTLRLDASLIESAKQYSVRTGKSVSKIVADLFSIIQNEKNENDFSLTPTVKLLKGTLSRTSVSKKDYQKYLEEKYL